jgi:hypothetical protein
MAESIKVHQSDIPAVRTAATELERRLAESGLSSSSVPLVHLCTMGDQTVGQLIATHAPHWSNEPAPGLDGPREAHLIVSTAEEVFVVGRGPVGVIVGVHRLTDRLLEQGTLGEFVELLEPRFPLRTVGHDELYLQPAGGYSREDHIRWAVRHGFTTIDIPWWMLEPDHQEEKAELVDLMERYDLSGLIQGKLLQIFPNVPEEALGYARLNSGTEIRTLCARSEYGRRVLGEWIRRALTEIPRVRVMTWYFFDVSFICQDNCPRCADTDILDRIVEFAQMVDRHAKDVNPAALTVIRTWHLMPEERRRLATILPDHLGVEAKLSAAGDEAYLPIPDYDPVYNPTERALYRVAGSRAIVEVPIGDCESVDSLIGTAIPSLTLRRLDDIEGWGAPGIRNWWSTSYWTYSPNYEVAGRAFFKPLPEASELVERIAVRDFGAQLAGEVVLFWSAWEKLVTRWPFRSWMQRMEIFTDRGYGSLMRAAIRPIRPEPFDRMLAHDRLLRPTSREFRRLVPRELESLGAFKEHPMDWVTPVLLNEYERILEEIDLPRSIIDRIADRARADFGKAPAGMRDRVDAQKRSFEYFASLFHTQYAFLRALWLTAQKRRVSDREEKCGFDREMEKVAQAELANTRTMMKLLEADPNPNMAHFGSLHQRRWKPEDFPLVPKQIELLEGKAKATEEWVESFGPHRNSGIPYAPYVSVDQRFYVWGEAGLYEETLVEQSRVLPWYGLEEARWIFPRADDMFKAGRS